MKPILLAALAISFVASASAAAPDPTGCSTSPTPEAAACRKRAAELPTNCGDEPGKPFIGMTLEQLKRCVPRLRKQNETHSTMGTMEMYMGNHIMVMTLDGVVNNWSAF